MGRITLIYGVVSYAAFFVTFLYAIGFLGNVLVPKSLDSGPIGRLGTALLVDLGLLAIFAVQHSVMARPAFKRLLTTVVSPSVWQRRAGHAVDHEVVDHEMGRTGRKR